MPHVWVTGYVMVHKQLTDPRTNVQNFVSHPTHIICIWYFVNFRHNKNVVILSKYCHFAFSSCNNLGVYWSGCTTFLIFHICDHPNILSVHDYPVVALESQKTGINLPIPQLCWSSCWVSLLHLLSGGLSVFDQFLSQFWLLCKPRAVVASTFSFRKFSSLSFFTSNFSLIDCRIRMLQVHCCFLSSLTSQHPVGNEGLSSFSLHYVVQDSSFLFKFCLEVRMWTLLNRKCCLILSHFQFFHCLLFGEDVVFKCLLGDPQGADTLICKRVNSRRGK